MYRLPVMCFGEVEADGDHVAFLPNTVNLAPATSVSFILLSNLISIASPLKSKHSAKE